MFALSQAQLHVLLVAFPTVCPSELALLVIKAILMLP